MMQLFFHHSKGFYVTSRNLPIFLLNVESQTKHYISFHYTLLKKKQGTLLKRPKLHNIQIAVTQLKITVEKRLKKHFEAQNFYFNVLVAVFENLLSSQFYIFKKVTSFCSLKICAFHTLQLDNKFFLKKFKTFTKKYTVLLTKCFFKNFRTIFFN